MVGGAGDGAAIMNRRIDSDGDRPLVAWGRALRRKRLARRRRLGWTCFVAIGTAPVGVTIARPPLPRLVWNASASAPVGLYAVSPGAPISVGDMVIAWPPPAARRLAAARAYLPAGVPLVKRVAAGPGDRICAAGDAITINGVAVTNRARTDGQGRPMPSWSDCRWLHAGDYLLLMRDVPTSFDGRYFGVTEASQIIGPATLLWAR